MRCPRLASPAKRSRRCSFVTVLYWDASAFHADCLAASFFTCGWGFAAISDLLFIPSLAMSPLELNRSGGSFLLPWFFELTQPLEPERGSSDKSRARGDDVNRNPLH